GPARHAVGPGISQSGDAAMTRTQHAQQGMAVIAALLVVIAAAVITSRIIEDQSLLARTLASERERAQAEWMLRSGMDWSRAILRFDAHTNATTRLDGIWAQPIVNLPVGPAGSPEQSLFTGQ